MQTSLSNWTSHILLLGDTLRFGVAELGTTLGASATYDCSKKVNNYTQGRVWSARNLDRSWLTVYETIQCN